VVSAALRRLMTAAEGAGELAGADVQHGAAEHPVCGDRIALELRCAGEVIAELAWRARGCPASVAAAAAAFSAWRGHPRAEAGQRLRSRLHELGDLLPHERHAERLVLEALDRAR
jgi:NifU-like protein involved in Fe-S cluster formation